MLVYDITDMNSFRTLQKWNSTLDEVCEWVTKYGIINYMSSCKAGVTGVDTVIIGNKQDLEELRVVPKETAEQVHIIQIVMQTEWLALLITRCWHYVKMFFLFAVCHSELQDEMYWDQCLLREKCHESISHVSRKSYFQSQYFSTRQRGMAVCNNNYILQNWLLDYC